MNPRIRDLVSSTVGLVPVRIRAGLGLGARWTLYPWSSYWRGSHEPSVQAAIGALGGGDIRGWSCWDLGAHFGYYSVAMAMRVGPGGQVAAFEPNPASFARLERHRRMNHLDWLRAYQAAVSDKSGASELLTYGDLGSTNTHLRYDDEAENKKSAPIGIRTLRLDDLVESGELRPPMFAKIDVEGHGHRALEGMKATVARHLPVLIIAFHSKAEVDGVLSILKPHGYRRTPIASPPADPESLIGGDYLFTP